MREEYVNEQQIRNVYGKYIKNITIINQERFIEHYSRRNGKSYIFTNDLDRLFTMHKLCMTAFDIFRGECYRNNRTYDIIIKIRPDLLLNDRFVLVPSLNDNQIVVPSNDSGGFFNDHIAYGKNQAMTKFLSSYKSFNEVDDSGCDVSVVEAGLKRHLETSDVNIIRNPIKYVILRDIKPQRVVYAGNKRGQFFVKKY